MKDPLPNIPRPAAELWRDIRLRYVPVLVYLAGVVLVVHLWRTQWIPSNFTGEVQAPFANVASPLDGLLVDLSVRQFDTVTRGQVIGKVIHAPEAVLANLAAMRSELQVMRARMILDDQRNQLNYQQLRVDQLDQKVQLAVAVSKLRYAESELGRQEAMRTNQIVSESDYEQALDQRDTLAAEVKERQELLREMASTLAPMKPAGPADHDSLILNAIDAALTAQEEQFRNSTEMILRSPIDGVVTKVLRNQDENITAGETLVTISDQHPDHIVGFVRQPIGFEPKVGDRVTVRTRRGPRQKAEARILKVGARLEFFTQPLRVRGFDSSQERGLPVLINLPDGLALHPGELVDLALQTDSGPEP